MTTGTIFKTSDMSQIYLVVDVCADSLYSPIYDLVALDDGYRFSISHNALTDWGCLELETIEIVDRG